MGIVRILLLLLPLVLSLYQLADKNLHKGYIFDPAKLQELSQQSIDKFGGTNANHTLLFQDLVERLQGEYGTQHIGGLKNEDWMFNNAGGAMVGLEFRCGDVCGWMANGQLGI